MTEHAGRAPVAPRPEEGGFTLVEVLVVIAVLAIISLPLTMAITTGLKTSARTASVLVSSSDRQFVTLYLTPDLSAATITPDTAAGTATGCAGASPGTNVLRVQTQEFSSSGTPATTLLTTYFASYRVVADGTEWQLVRYACTSGGTATSTVVAHDLQGSGAATATLSGRSVSLAITDTLGAVYTVSGTRRAP